MKEIILLGNPNTGKTTLFNSLTKSSEHTGNWHGVTVDEKSKVYNYNNAQYKIVDLPGIYSLTPNSIEEEVSVNYLYSHKNTLVVNIVDINNLRRNLFLTMELLEAKIPFILVVNNTSNETINEKELQKGIGAKVVVINAKNKNEVGVLKQEIEKYYISGKQTSSIEIKYENTINSTFGDVINSLKINEVNIKLPETYIAKKCLENDCIIINKLNLSNNDKDILKNLERKANLEQIIENNYKQIDNILFGIRHQKITYGKNKLDKFVLNKYLCMPIFFGVLLLVFYLTFFSVGAILSDALSSFLHNILGRGILNVIGGITNNVIIYDFFETAIIGGMGAVLSFLPQVVIMFLCLGLLEDSGYLSRVAFSLDDIFSKFGLSGKSVYTLLMGFGCSTSACMTARTMEDKNAKIKTAMLAPYMSCSAKLPIYFVIGSAFFGASNVFVIFGLYLLGVLVALSLSMFYEKTFLKSKSQSFIFEFPPYRMVTIKRVLGIVFKSGKDFLFRIGSLLVSMNIIIWILSSFSFDFSFVMISSQPSMLEGLGKVLAPIFLPLGFGTWGATSALVAGLIAKEIIVSSIAMFNGISSNFEGKYGELSKSLTLSSSPVFFTPASALSFMVFCLLYTPCFASIAVLKKEIGKKWLVVSMLVQFALAYICSIIIYGTTSLIIKNGIIGLLICVIIASLVSFSIYYLLNAIKQKRLCPGCKKCNKQH